MATGQDLLDTMELLNQELQLQSGEVDVVRGLRALNLAQDYFESLAATRGDLMGGHTGTVVTASGVETTTFPTGLLRVDALQKLHDTTGRPERNLTPMQRVGGQMRTLGWPWPSLLATSSGAPTGYWANRRSIYWAPLPNGVYTVRWHGWQAQADITAAGTFAYEDIVVLPLASFAVKLMRHGVDDSTEDIGTLAQGVFKSTLDALEMSSRDGAQSLQYTRAHTE